MISSKESAESGISGRSRNDSNIDENIVIKTNGRKIGSSRIRAIETKMMTAIKMGAPTTDNNSRKTLSIGSPIAGAHPMMRSIAVAWFKN